MEETTGTMKIRVIHKKPAAYDLFYPADEWTTQFLKIFNMHKPPAAFTLKQMRALKDLGFEIEVTSGIEIKDIEI